MIVPVSDSLSKRSSGTEIQTQWAAEQNRGDQWSWIALIPVIELGQATR